VVALVPRCTTEKVAEVLGGSRCFSGEQANFFQPSGLSPDRPV